jgi:hypothetical protein
LTGARFRSDCERKVIYRALADAVLIGHLAFVLFAIFGGLLAHWQRRVIWLHLPALAWGVYIELSGNICPLTPLENRLREKGGAAGYSGDFIDHYVGATLYPAGLSHPTQLVLAAILAGINLLVYAAIVVRGQRERAKRAGQGLPIVRAS